MGNISYVEGYTMAKIFKAKSKVNAFLKSVICGIPDDVLIVIKLKGESKPKSIDFWNGYNKAVEQNNE